jgi:hypothetical protein
MSCINCCFITTSSNTLQITPEDKVYKLAKHKHAKINQDKTIHLVHLNENNNSSSFSFKQTLVPKNAFTLNETDTNRSVQLEQPRPISSQILAASDLNTKNSSNNLRDEFSVQIVKSDPNSVTSTNSESNEQEKVSRDLESYDTFTNLLRDSKFRLEFKRNCDCLVADKTFGFSVYYRKKIRLISNDSNPNSSTTTRSLRPPVLFFIHGVGGSAMIWKNQLDFFSQKGYECIAIDLLGHGLSSKPAHAASLYTFRDIASDLIYLFDNYVCNLNKDETDKNSTGDENAKNNVINSNIVVIGHSYGCSFATYLAQHRKEFISKLILIAGYFS